jgi:hypothetical protein
MVRNAWGEYEAALLGEKKRSLAENLGWAAVRAKPLLQELLVLFMIGVAPRRRCPALAALGIPLAMVAATLMSMPLSALCALIACGWWFGANRSKWEVVAIAGRGVVGTAWALVGMNLLLAFPSDRLEVGILWTYSALAMAWIGYRARGRRWRA